MLTSTIFHGTKIPVKTWIFVILEMCASKNGVAAREIQRKYDLTPKAAWFMCHRIREGMRIGPAALMTGTVTADETWIGGQPKFRHKGDLRQLPRRRATDKTPGVQLAQPRDG